MPTPFMCHECDGYTMNAHGICDACIEPTTADEFNKELYMKDVSPHDPGDENDNVPVITGDRDTDALLEDERIAQEELAYLEGEKNPLKAIKEIEKDLESALNEIDRLRGGLHMCKELAMLRDNYGMIESVAEEHLNAKG